MRRCPTLLAVFTAVLTLAARPQPAEADGITTPGTATYSISIPGGLPDPGTDVNNVNPSVSLPQVEAQVNPPGGIVPPTNPDGTQGSPLTILPDSFGFDPNHLVVALNNNPKTNPTDQKFGLVFFNGGLAPNNLLHFSLSIDKALTTPPTLDVISPTSPSGLVIKPDPVATTGGSDPNAPGVPPVNTPEPLSVLVWSGLAGLGLVRARGLRHARPASAA
jgi:hypothetical protein